ncbi:SDR family NAD(P)-dependent oxidoreductase [Carbonactinospora thermoautotrophica]|uniref:SDR family NAD(P)-dependent oxidoreductase n=1 Tax=Carbonactinospora thermoautotrophica TaxID=1469144 RepID=UPI003DA85E46
MSTRFAGKVALVTGGGSGIGRATALAFAREGAAVVVAGRNPEPLTETVKLIEADGGRAAVVTADITRSADVARLVETTAERYGGLHIAFNNAGVFTVETTAERYGGLHIAFNNAGVFTAGPLVDLDEAEWARIIEINVTGTWLSMKHEIAYMREHGGGVIINMSSSVGPHITVPGLGAYAASKAAVSSLTRTAAREHIRDGIRINAISPGPCDTPMSMLPGETEAERAERMKEQVPIGRVGTLEEVAATVLWLASPESGFAVGHDLVIDGGGSA